MKPRWLTERQAFRYRPKLPLQIVFRTDEQGRWWAVRDARGVDLESFFVSKPTAQRWRDAVALPERPSSLPILMAALRKGYLFRQQSAGPIEWILLGKVRRICERVYDGPPDVRYQLNLIRGTTRILGQRVRVYVARGVPVAHCGFERWGGKPYIMLAAPWNPEAYTKCRERMRMKLLHRHRSEPQAERPTR